MTTVSGQAHEEEQVAARQRWRAAVLRAMAEDCGAIGDRPLAADRWRRVSNCCCQGQSKPSRSIDGRCRFLSLHQ